VTDERIDWHWRVDGRTRRAQVRELFTAELMLDADSADLTDDEPVKLSGGWLIFEQHGSKHRIRLSCIARYVYSPCTDATYVHILGRVEEISGDHSAVLDTYFAEHPDT
jgi:hypothetical protein